MKIVSIKSGDDFDYYIGRENRYYGLPGSKFANPYVIGRDGTRKECISMFAEWLPTQPELMRDLHEIDNKTLACWCDFPNEDCHGRVLIEARQKQIEEEEAKKPKVKLAVVGSRTFDDKERLFALLDKHINRIEMIVSGGAQGADELARQWCEERGVPCLIYYANWRPKGGEFDRGAGFKRNWAICRAADSVIAYWDGVSKGTAHNFEICESLGKPIKILRFTPKPKPQPEPEPGPNPEAPSQEVKPKKRGRPAKPKTAPETPATEQTPEPAPSDIVAEVKAEVPPPNLDDMCKGLPEDVGDTPSFPEVYEAGYNKGVEEAVKVVAKRVESSVEL